MTSDRPSGSGVTGKPEAPLRAEGEAREVAEILSAANLALTQNFDLKTILDTLLDQLVRWVPYDSASVLLLVGDTRLVIAASRGLPESAETRDVVIDSKTNRIFSRMLQTGESILIPDTQGYAGWERRPTSLNVRSWLGVPLLSTGQVIGAYSLDKSTPGFFTEQHRRLTEGLAAPAAIAIQNGRLFERVLKHTAELEHRMDDQRRAEEELREARGFSEQIISNAGEGIIVYDHELKYVLWNRFMEQLTGLSKEEVLGSSPLDLFPHVREQGVWQLLQRALRGETVVSADLPYAIAKTGRSGWVSGTYAPNRNAKGAITGVIGVIRDVTDHRRAEEELVRLAAIVESSDDGIVATDVAGTIVHWNRGAERIYGYTAAEVRGRPVSLLEPPDRRGEVAAFIERVRWGEGVARYETVRLKKDGTPIEVSVTLSLVRNASGEVLGVASIARDITGRNRADEALKAAESRFRGLVEQSIVGIAILQDNKLLYVNPKFADIFGYTQEELLNSKTVRDLVAEEDWALVQRKIRERESGEVEGNHYKACGLRRDGTRIQLEIHGVRTEIGGRTASLTTILDLTSLQASSREPLRRS